LIPIFSLNRNCSQYVPGRPEIPSEELFGDKKITDTQKQVGEYIKRARQFDNSFKLGKSSIYRRVGKRMVDIFGGGILLILTSPIIFAAWLIVRLSSPGPGFFSQERVGHSKKTIRVLKMRSMYIDHADRINLQEVEEHQANGLLYKPKNDPRITPFGRFIRKTSIDELPQLWNVVKGDMSLVGPRPLMLHMVKPFPEINTLRALVKPGITGEWQVNARDDNTSIESMIVYDLHYIENHSLKMDVLLLFQTIPAVLKTRGAH
jgi:lipopolysaccharide/colanic/teichoic acid biosynthesis glycosyltransferase